jgi:hypothetical protein
MCWGSPAVGVRQKSILAIYVRTFHALLVEVVITAPPMAGSTPESICRDMRGYHARHLR